MKILKIIFVLKIRGTLKVSSSTRYDKNLSNFEKGTVSRHETFTSSELSVYKVHQTLSLPNVCQFTVLRNLCSLCRKFSFILIKINGESK